MLPHQSLPITMGAKKHSATKCMVLYVNKAQGNVASAWETATLFDRKDCVRIRRECKNQKHWFTVFHVCKPKEAQLFR